ncbi:MAG TPA: PAS domain S-box protein [Acetobacteraceae bacterium]|nr:PAS domain S-box protein [Acetobacteraceae bacterium]
MKHGLLDAPALQQMLYQALDDSDDLVLVLEQISGGPEGLLVAATNDAFCRTAGIGSTDLVGKPFLGFAAPEADIAGFHAVAEAAEERRSFRSEILCRRADGPPFWFGLHLMPVAGSNPACSVVLGRDITAVLRDRQQHRAIQGLLAKVFVSVQAAVAIVDEHGMFLMNNPALDHLLGVQPDALNGRQSLEVVAPEGRTVVLRARQRQLAGGEAFRIETTLLRSDGSRLPVEVAGTMVARDDLKRFRILTVTPRQPAAEAAATTTVRVAGKIKLIGLEDVKTALGERWPSVAARVMTSAEHVIQRRCGPQDSWSRTADSGFLICFAEGTEEESGFRAAAIAREIRTRLIGEGEPATTAYVSAVTTTVTIPNQPGTTPDTISKVINQRMNARLAEIEAKARETLAQAVREANCSLMAVRSRMFNEVVGHFAALPIALEHRVQSAIVALPIQEAREVDYDRLVLGLAATQVISTLGTAQLRPIYVAVEFDVFLDRRSAERYVTACKSMDERLRQHLVVVLSRLPHGVAKSRVTDCVMRLRPLCHAVGYQAEGLTVPPVELSMLAGAVVTVRAEEIEGLNANDMARLEKLIGVVRAHRGYLMVRDVASWDSAKRLMRPGIDLYSLAEA